MRKYWVPGDAIVGAEVRTTVGARAGCFRHHTGFASAAHRAISACHCHLGLLYHVPAQLVHLKLATGGLPASEPPANRWTVLANP